MSDPLGYGEPSYDVEIPYWPAADPTPLAPNDAESGVRPPPASPPLDVPQEDQ